MTPSCQKAFWSFAALQKMLIANCPCAFQDSELLPRMPVNIKRKLIAIPFISL